MNRASIGAELLDGVDRLDREVKVVFRTVVAPTWGGELHGLPDALYGFMMGVFARIDLASAYWKGSAGGNQTERMVSFMDQFFGTTHDANSVAVQIWRHKLMHTAEPRALRDPGTGLRYRWLLHWWEHLPEEQHFTFSLAGGLKILNIGLVYLIQDLRSAIVKYVDSLGNDPDATHRYQTFAAELASYELRQI